ncbi:MAG: hypothetical protein FWF45_00600 [Coriobacteriia bacterium]|nr:hypothetical protein [Coriobacteriia bacterium]
MRKIYDWFADQSGWAQFILLVEVVLIALSVWFLIALGIFNHQLARAGLALRLGDFMRAKAVFNFCPPAARNFLIKAALLLLSFLALIAVYIHQLKKQHAREYYSCSPVKNSIWFGLGIVINVILIVLIGTAIEQIILLAALTLAAAGAGWIASSA